MGCSTVFFGLRSLWEAKDIFCKAIIVPGRGIFQLETACAHFFHRKAKDDNTTKILNSTQSIICPSP
jgi:hypothetical protein